MVISHRYFLEGKTIDNVISGTNNRTFPHGRAMCSLFQNHLSLDLCRGLVRGVLQVLRHKGKRQKPAVNSPLETPEKSPFPVTFGAEN